ncbi:MAG: hypothetical protein ACK48W_00450 [Bacteroidota bacterium]|jgi:hypothetical protein
MKNLFKTFIAVAIVSVTVQSCKKGEDDPGLSLSSRKARFAGEWTIDAWDDAGTSVNTNNSSSAVTTSTEVYSTKITGNTYTSTSNFTSTAAGSTASSTTTNGTVSEATYTIEKDGTWSSVMTIKITSQTNVFGGVSTTDALDVTQKVEASGTWQFLGKNSSADLKNKEAVMLSTAKEVLTITNISTSGGSSKSDDVYTTTYALNEKTEVWTLSQLAKKEMVANVTYDNISTEKSTFTSGSSSTTSNDGPDSNKGTTKITFKQ